MGDRSSDSGIPAAAGGLGGLFAAAAISDAVSGNNVVFVGLWIVCGVVLYAVAAAVVNHLESMH